MRPQHRGRRLAHVEHRARHLPNLEARLLRMRLGSWVIDHGDGLAKKLSQRVGWGQRRRSSAGQDENPEDRDRNHPARPAWDLHLLSR